MSREFDLSYRSDIAVNLSIDLEKDEFCMLVGKQGIHSFLMIAVRQKGAASILPLVKIGKQSFNFDKVRKQNKGKIPYTTNCLMGLKAFFYQAEAELASEPLYISGAFSYLAYSISYTQYREFLDLLKVIQREDSEVALECFQPVLEKRNDVTLSYQIVDDQGTSEDPNKQRLAEYATKIRAFSNTCRHTAIDLLKEGLNISQKPAALSNSFYRKLPCTATVEKRKIITPVYIFPLPPKLNSKLQHPENAQKKELLMLIFKRMEKLRKKAPHEKETFAKFEALRKLYEQEAEVEVKENQNLNLKDIFERISAWKTKNSDAVTALRKQGIFGRVFVSKSTTEKMIDNYLENIKKKLPPGMFNQEAAKASIETVENDDTFRRSCTPPYLSSDDSHGG